jgi:hypothetical protein
LATPSIKSALAIIDASSMHSLRDHRAAVAIVAQSPPTRRAAPVAHRYASKTLRRWVESAAK